MDHIDEESKHFIEQHHYSKSARSQKAKHVFKLIDHYDNLVGVAVYGDPTSIHYNGTNTIELRRLCLIDDTPKNTESYFIGRTLRWMKKNTEYSKVLSFADPNHGHQGIIYRASNFKYEGRETYDGYSVEYQGTSFTKREVYQKTGGEYTSRALELQAAIKSGEAKQIKLERKHRYVYEL